MQKSKLSVLVVDDDNDIRYAIVRILSKCDCDVVEAGTVELALEQLQSNDFDVIFSDMRFSGGLGGQDLLKYTQENYPLINVVLMSSAMQSPAQAELKAQGAAYCLQKPFFRDTCLTVLNSLTISEQKAA